MPEILLNGPIGRLEARYTHNNKAASPSILILHAHPGHGGNMNNPLSLKVHKFFSDIGYSSLRFNFRGVGKSDGEHDGSEGELADSAIASKVIVPVPDVFHPALVTVITLEPLALERQARTLICPSVPAAIVCV